MTKPKLTSLYSKIGFDFPPVHCGICFNLSVHQGQGVGMYGQQWTEKAYNLYFMTAWEIMYFLCNRIFCQPHFSKYAMKQGRQQSAFYK